MIFARERLGRERTGRRLAGDRELRQGWNHLVHLSLRGVGRGQRQQRQLLAAARGREARCSRSPSRRAAISCRSRSARRRTLGRCRSSTGWSAARSNAIVFRAGKPYATATSPGPAAERGLPVQAHPLDRRGPQVRGGRRAELGDRVVGAIPRFRCWGSPAPDIVMTGGGPGPNSTPAPVHAAECRQWPEGRTRSGTPFRARRPGSGGRYDPDLAVEEWFSGFDRAERFRPSRPRKARPSWARRGRPRQRLQRQEQQPPS